MNAHLCLTVPSVFISVIESDDSFPCDSSSDESLSFSIGLELPLSLIQLDSKRSLGGLVDIITLFFNDSGEGNSVNVKQSVSG